MDAQLIEILCCPENHQPVQWVEASLLEALNRRVTQGGLINRGGQKISIPLEAGLMRRDGRFVYPVRNGIPLMLIDEAIPLDDGSVASARTLSSASGTGEGA